MNGRPGGPGPAEMELRFARGAVTLGVGSILSAAFVFTPTLPEFIDLVDVSLPGSVVFVALGILSILGGARRNTTLCTIAGLAFLVAAAAQVLQLATGMTILGGDASSLALLAAWGVGLLSISWAERNTPTPHGPTQPTQTTDGLTP